VILTAKMAVLLSQPGGGTLTGEDPTGIGDILHGKRTSMVWRIPIRRMGLVALVTLLAGIQCVLGWALWRAFAKEPPGTAPATEADPWIVASSLDFSTARLSPDWKVRAGQASAEGGALVLSAAGKEAEIMLAKPTVQLPSVRVEFEAAVSSQGTSREISVYVGANSAGCAGGYLFQLGVDGNQNRIRRVGRIVPETVNRSFAPQAGRSYRVAVENDQGRLLCTVDGQVVLRWDDPQPVWGPQHDHVGFYTWDARLAIRNLRIHVRLSQVQPFFVPRTPLPASRPGTQPVRMSPFKEPLVVLFDARKKGYATVEDFLRLLPGAFGFAGRIHYTTPRDQLVSQLVAAGILREGIALDLDEPLTKGAAADILVQSHLWGEGSLMERLMTSRFGSTEAAFRVAVRQRLVPKGHARQIMSIQDLGATLVATAMLSRSRLPGGADLACIDGFVKGLVETFISVEEVQAILELNNVDPINVMLTL